MIRINVPTPFWSKWALVPDLVREVPKLLIDAFGVIADEVRKHGRVDVPLAFMVFIFLVAYVPIIPVNTDNPQLLTFINDEAPLSMALDGMRATPYGDPYNFVSAPAKDKPYPKYYGDLKYVGVGYYYGGLYGGIAFLGYGPLQALGLPPFPTAPIILRIVSALAGLWALLIAYNFASYHFGRVAAVVSGILVLTEPLFVYYSMIVHPDILQFALSLLALAISLRHLNYGDKASLVAMGILSGLIQGTKLGGPWLIPIFALATVVGLRHQKPHLGGRSFAWCLAQRGAALVLVSLAAWIISTPYAFLEPDFFAMTKVVYSMNVSSWFSPVTFSSWVYALWNHCGALLMSAALGSIIVIIGTIVVTKKIPWPLILVFVLGLSQLLWFAILNKLWVVVAYLFTTVGMIALLSGASVGTVCGVVARSGSIGRIVAGIIAGLAILLSGSGRWFNIAQSAVNYRAMDFNSFIQIGRWAANGNLPSNSRILWDDIAYFDRERFPNGHMLGGLLTYNNLHERQPEYIVLSASMYDLVGIAI